MHSRASGHRWCSCWTATWTPPTPTCFSHAPRRHERPLSCSDHRQSRHRRRARAAPRRPVRVPPYRPRGAHGSDSDSHRARDERRCLEYCGSVFPGRARILETRGRVLIQCLGRALPAALGVARVSATSFICIRPSVTLAAPRDDDELEELLSRPAPAVSTRCVACPAMSSSSAPAARWARRSPRWCDARADALGDARTVIAVSRFSSPDAARALERRGRRRWSRAELGGSRRHRAHCPTRRTSSSWPARSSAPRGMPALTWAMNTLVPATGRRALRDVAHRRVLDRQRVPAHAGRRRRLARERPARRPSASTRPRASDASACFEHYRATRGTPMCDHSPQLRGRPALRRARRHRARASRRGEPVRVDMGYVNVIWQGDANAQAIARSARCAASPPFVVNVTGPETLSVRDVAESVRRAARRRRRAFDGHRSARRAAQRHALAHRAFGTADVSHGRS